VKILDFFVKSVIIKAVCREGEDSHGS